MTPRSRPPSPALPDELAEAAAWPAARQREFLRFLRVELAHGWRDQARPEQLPPDGEWNTLFLRGGRGSGKSWAGSHILAELIADDPLRDTDGPGQWAVIAPTFSDVRETCVESPDCGLLAALGTSPAEVAAGESGLVATYNRSLGELRLHDGSVIFMDSADDGALTLQGKNARGVWAEEVGLWKRWSTAFDESIAYALRKGSSRLVITGTPKANMPARALVRRLLEDHAVVSRRLRTMDNAANLSDSFLQAARLRAGTRLARQELEGELLEEAEGAMWAREWIDDHRVQQPPPPRHTVIGLDPSSGQGRSAQGLVIASLGNDNRAYILRAEALHTSPLAYLTHAIRLASEHTATLIIETNYGDAMMIGLLEQAIEFGGRNVAYKTVAAKTGKIARADQAAALYERGLVSHVAELDALEDQMLTFTGMTGEPSDLVDSLGHALAELERFGIGRPPVDERAGVGAVPWGGDGTAVEGAAIPWDTSTTWLPGQFPPGP